MALIKYKSLAAVLNWQPLPRTVTIKGIGVLRSKTRRPLAVTERLTPVAPVDVFAALSEVE